MHIDLDDFQHNTRQASRLLKAMSNEHRLMILCQLIGGEKCVTELEHMVGLSQSAISQHLARLRGDTLVRTRRDGQAIFYSLAGTATTSVIETLHGIFCGNGGMAVVTAEKAPSDPMMSQVLDLLSEVARNTCGGDKAGAAGTRDRKTCCLLFGNGHNKECCMTTLRRTPVNGSLRPVRRPLSPTPRLTNGNGCRAR